MGLFFGACAPTAPTAEQSARDFLKQARSEKLTPEQRAVLYLDAAAEASRAIAGGADGKARAIYNQATVDLVLLLHSARGGSLWNRPLELTSGATTYHLRFAGKSNRGVWDPAGFTSYVAASDVDPGNLKHMNRIDAMGGTLVGIHKATPLAQFSPRVGITAPVTAALDIRGKAVTLSLLDPTKAARAQMAGASRVISADFSAPLAYYPQESEFLSGVMGAMHVAKHMGITGLYQLEPYDPERIPLVFVHGLISTPRMWRSVINDLKKDPEIRSRYQCLAFAYPTGNPPAYSALRLREELEKYRAQYPQARDMVMVGHSMGGLLTRMQTCTLRREDWDAIGKDKAAALFRRVKPGDLVHRSAIFEANPHIDRAVFICTPHRGSRMAVGTLGELGVKLIRLPGDIAAAATSALGDSLAILSGSPSRVPTSIDGLSPSNPAYRVFDSISIRVPHHSIIGDRGKGDTPKSSDGVVEYWSSHLESATSEKIVPGPHGACELPETIEELRRILHLHLKSP